ncbi:asparaginase [Paenibacillus lentus]|uniref:Asparaginase n=1 Tax=Paenibacillus lentus TaxID=1338368 RepID=A0A3Q8SEN4_9BACL|nr:asparaginase [Paenibacillus lentus]AZK48924.1 asparaginase [Paenibacillus lentus]
MDSFRDTILVEEYRGDILECSHRGFICVVDEKGRIFKYAGAPYTQVFTRSAAKPLQAIPAIRAGIQEAYQLTDAEIAVMTASHRAEDVHMDVLKSLISKIGVEEEGLVCAPSLPLDRKSREALLRSGGDRRRLYHNCSGKHLGVLAYCKMMGFDLKSYHAPTHPVQQEIVDTIASLAEMAVEDIGRGTDGCGFPVFALPLSALATAYLKLVCPDLIKDTRTAEAVRQITRAMNARPELVGGSGRIDSVLMEDDNIIAKGGFKGVYCFSLKRERLGIAFKVSDGSEEEWGRIVLEILHQLNYANEELLLKLQEQFPSRILNDEGSSVGHMETVFTLIN